MTPIVGNRLFYLLILVAISCTGAISKISNTRGYNARHKKAILPRAEPALESYIIADGSSDVTQTALKSIANLLSTCGFGVLTAKLGILDGVALSVLSKLVFSIFQPCFLFASVFKVVSKISTSTEQNVAIFLLPVAAMLQVVLGFIGGKAASLLLYRTKQASQEAKSLLACCTFSNSGPLPLVFAAGIFKSNDALFQKVAAYISLYLLGWSPFFWLLGPMILDTKSPNDQASAQTKTFKDKVITLSKRVLSPPIMASLVGMLVGTVGPLRALIQGPDGIFNPALEAVTTIGAAYLPAVLLVLAGSLASSAAESGTEGNTNSKPVGPTNMITAIAEAAKNNSSFASQVLILYLAKFLLIPTTVFGMIAFMQKKIPSVATWLKNDPVLFFVLLLETCMPSAQNLTLILNLQGKKEASATLAKLLLFVYVLGVPAICYWLIRILELTAILK